MLGAHPVSLAQSEPRAAVGTARVVARKELQAARWAPGSSGGERVVERSTQSSPPPYGITQRELQGLVGAERHQQANLDRIAVPTDSRAPSTRRSKSRPRLAAGFGSLAVRSRLDRAAALSARLSSPGSAALAGRRRSPSWAGGARALTRFFWVSSWGLRRIEWPVCEAIRHEERTLLITGTLLRRRSPLLFSFVVSAFALALAACGGDSESGGSPASQGGPGPGRGFAQDPEVRACLQKEGVTLPQGGRGGRPGGGDRPDGSGRPTGTNAVPPTGTNARPPGGTDARPPRGAGRDPEQFAKRQAALQKCGVEIGNGPPGGAPPNGAATQTTPDAGS